MDEFMERTKFMNKASALAKSSRQYIEGLWKIGIDVSGISAFIASFFSSIFNTLVKAFARVVSLGTGIREFTLTRFLFFPPFDLTLKRVTPPEEEYFPSEMGRANVSFLLRVNAAKKIATEFARRVSVKTPEPTILPIPAHRVEVELEEEFAKELMEEIIEEPAPPVSYFVTDLQRRLESKLAPSVRGMTSALREYSRYGVSLAPSTMGSRPFLLTSTPRLWHAPSKLFVALPEKVTTEMASAPQVGLHQRPSDIGPREQVKIETTAPSAEPAIVMPAPPISMPIAGLRPGALRSLEYATRLPRTISEQEVPILGTIPAFLPVSARAPPQTPSPPRKEAKIETPLPSAKLAIRMTAPPVSMPIARLGHEATSSLEYATRLPSTVSKREVPILTAMRTFPRIPAPKSLLHGIEPSSRYPTTTWPLVRPSQIDRLLEEIVPSLALWIHAVSKMLRSTALGLPAVSLAASTIEKDITQALIHAMPSFENLRMLGTRGEPFSVDLTFSGPEIGVERIAVEEFSIPRTVSSLVATHSQKYSPLISEPPTSQTWEPFKPTQASLEEPGALSEVPGVKEPSKLETMVGLAAVESSIARGLHQQFTTLMREIHVARSSYGERLGELDAFGPVGATMGSKLARAPALLSTLQPRMARGPSVPIVRAPSLPRMQPVSPTIQNTFKITISAEEAEQDLRDLERRVAQILSDQIRRYYGSMRI